jgi:hypothetical protein
MKDKIFFMTISELVLRIEGRVKWMFWDFKRLKSSRRLEDREGQLKIIWERSHFISSGCSVQKRGIV